MRIRVSLAISRIALAALVAASFVSFSAAGAEPEAPPPPAPAPAPAAAKPAPPPDGKPLVVEDGRTISVEYTLKLDDGSTADSNVGQQPLQFVQGEHRILPSLEQALAGLKVNDTKQVTISAADGYGPVDPTRRQTVPTDKIPEQARQVGAMLVASDGQGQQVPVKVLEVKPEEITLDLNHPLAGKTLHFDVKVVAIQ